jgi:hypothetical protein
MNNVDKMCKEVSQKIPSFLKAERLVKCVKKISQKIPGPLS